MSGNPRGADSAPAIPTRSKTGRKGAGPNAFPRRPPGNELFRAELGCGQRLSGDSTRTRALGRQAPRLLSSSPVPSNLSLNAPRQGLQWVQSSRPSLQKLAREGKGTGRSWKPSRSFSLRHVPSRGPFKPGALRGIRKQRGCVYLAIYSSSQTCAPWGVSTEDSLGARGAAARGGIGRPAPRGAHSSRCAPLGTSIPPARHRQ